MKNCIDILLIEDDVHDLELAVRGLERYHLSNDVNIVRDGEQALDFIFATGLYEHRTAGGDLGLILLDLHLPRISGLEVLQAVKADSRTSNIPVVVLTSSSEGPDIVESYRLGARGYMLKPVDFHKLVETVRQLGFHWSLMEHAPT